MSNFAQEMISSIPGYGFGEEIEKCTYKYI